MSRSRHSRTGMSGVVVFGLRSVGFAIQGDITRVEKHQHRRRRVRVTEEYYETALVPDLLPEKAVVQGVPPSGAVGVGDGLKRLVREGAIDSASQFTQPPDARWSSILPNPRSPVTPVERLPFLDFPSSTRHRRS